MSFYPVLKKDPVETFNSLTGTLILPIVSIGNVPQLSIDLLVNNIAPDVELIGYLDNLYLVPFASPIDSVSESKTDVKQGISTSLELYHSESKNITILQQRSPILPGCNKLFIENLLAPFISSSGFKKILILESKDLGLKDDKFDGKNFQLWSNNITEKFSMLNLNNIDNTNKDIAVLKDTVEISKFSSALINTILRDTKEFEDNLKPTPSEINLVKLLKDKYPLSLPLSRDSTSNGNNDNTPSSKEQEKSPDVLLLSTFVYEGDNFHDAELLSDKVSLLLSLPNTEDWKKPQSWRGVYGDKPVPVGMELGIYS